MRGRGCGEGVNAREEEHAEVVEDTGSAALVLVPGWRDCIGEVTGR